MLKINSIDHEIFNKESVVTARLLALIDSAKFKSKNLGISDETILKYQKDL